MPNIFEFIRFNSSYGPIASYINEQYERYFTAEKGSKLAIEDTRVHALIYFLPPTPAFVITDLDLEALKVLTEQCNLIPVIAKSDSLSRDELMQLKKTVKC